jgi:hypothetical protein
MSERNIQSPLQEALRQIGVSNIQRIGMQAGKACFGGYLEPVARPQDAERIGEASADQGLELLPEEIPGTRTVVAMEGRSGEIVVTIFPPGWRQGDRIPMSQEIYGINDDGDLRIIERKTFIKCEMAAAARKNAADEVFAGREGMTEPQWWIRTEKYTPQGDIIIDGRSTSKMEDGKLFANMPLVGKQELSNQYLMHSISSLAEKFEDQQQEKGRG